ncbi:MAG: heme ABC exporter ATP-binding protein CcmA [Acidobacteriota bacterium]|nr:heme ABC exporter ATP-binding protein CcmA [Acidobacteriota bacterium]MDH3522958.1 heme ABC exporter ATP-binding protein CcmA [Acidobacteriota bacterium]
MGAHARESAVHASGLGRRFGRYWALAHVDLEVPYGTSVWLRGSNGAGKTTLLRLVASLSTPSCGELAVGGHDVYRQRAAIRRSVSLVSHALYLYAGLTARETLAMWAQLGGTAAAARDVERRLDEVGLAAAADRRVGEFSAGMRKRLALARALLEAPRILLLDEPFSSLDRAGCELVEAWVRRFAETGGTVLMASHDHERSRALCERVIDLEDGQIVGRETLRATGDPS